MRLSQEMVDHTSRLLPELGALQERLEQEPQAIIPQTMFAGRSALRQSVIVENSEREAPSHPIFELDLESKSDVLEELLGADLKSDRERNVRAATSAVSKLRAYGADANFEPAEINGLEAIIIEVGRPAILIQNGRFFPPPLGWEILDQQRSQIETTLQSVGRIEVRGHPNLEWVGTGFLVAEDVVMTNRHVAKEFCRQEANLQWTFEPGMRTNIDYVAELGAANELEFAFEQVIGVHDRFDLALFKVAVNTANGGPSPEPLTLTSTAPDAIEGRKVYAVGYPAWDGRRNDPITMQRIFSDIYGVKRLQPGDVRAYLDQEALLHHDCSTLGGNSGSCVVDIETNEVVGLHFGGLYRETNKAVALWKLTDDSLLKEAKVNFG